jgi:hypothetical protein
LETELKVKSNYNIMKKNVFLIAIFAVAMLFSNETTAQKFRGLDKSPLDVAMYSTKADGPIMKIIYSRPQLKGRTVESLAKPGKVWRLGANESTEVIFYKDVTFGGTKIKAGTYTMYAIPGKSEWKFMINSKLHTWGAGSYKEANNVATVKGKVSNSSKSIEAFSITYANGNAYFGWGNTLVAVSVK